MKEQDFSYTRALLRGDLRLYAGLPFWSWNGELEIPRLLSQIDRMAEWGLGGFFMHARGGLRTDYLGARWMDCVYACAVRAKERGLAAYLYDENGWPSGFAGGKLLDQFDFRDRYLTATVGAADPDADYVYASDGARTADLRARGDCVNVFVRVSPSTVDICNPQAVEAFVGLTHEAYRKRFGAEFEDLITGFFTDEPQYFRNATAFSPLLDEYFRSRYGESVYDGLGLLFIETAKSARFRFRYWEGMQTLMRRGFGARTYDFCEAHGMRLTGHYVEETTLAGQMDCCAGIMPFYEYEHIPGIDKLGREPDDSLAPLQAASVAAQLGRKSVLSESFGCCGWDVTPRELKRIAESQFVAGVNLLCWHLLPYAENGSRKRDYPAHYSDCNPWVRRYFAEFNAYFNRLSAFLTESERPVSVAVLHPIKSAYCGFDRGKEDGGIGALDAGLKRLTAKLESLHIQFHFVDETLLAAHGGAENGSLRMGVCRYGTLIVPDCDLVLRSTVRILSEFRRGGGRLYCCGRIPRLVEGEPEDLTSLFASDTTLDAIRAAQPFSVDGPVRTAYLVNPDGRFLYAVNVGAPCEADLGEPSVEFDLQTQLSTPRPRRVRFAEYESKLLRLDGGSAVGSGCAAEEEPAVVTITRPFDVIACEDNRMTLDRARYATQESDFSDPLPIAEIFESLLRARYRGGLRLCYEFAVETLPERVFLEAEEMRTRRVTVNGRPVEASGYDGPFRLCRIDIAAALRPGVNRIVFETEFFQSPNVYYALFGEGVTESLKNCLVYDTEIENVYLAGDFGVGAKRMRSRDGICYAEGFFLTGARRTGICEPACEGYPFFAGEMTVETEIDIARTPAVLRLDGRFHAAEVWLDGRFAGRMLLSDRLPFAGVGVGAHRLRLRLTIGNRNLLGPHHCLDPEPHFVTPDTFSARKAVRSDYALVEWGLMTRVR